MIERNFISINLHPDMFKGVSETNYIGRKTVDINDLVGLKFISSLKNRAVIGELRKYGVDVPQDPDALVFQLMKDDVLYVVQPKINGGADRRVYEFRDEDSLPENTSFEITKWYFV